MEKQTTGDIEEEEWLRLGVAAAMHRQYAADHREFLETLAVALRGQIPEQVEVLRKGWGVLGRRRVHELRVTLGDRRYTLAWGDAGQLHGRRTLIKRGIALVSDDLTVDDWIAEVCEALEDQAAGAARITSALQRAGAAKTAKG